MDIHKLIWASNNCKHMWDMGSIMNPTTRKGHAWIVGGLQWTHKQYWKDGRESKVQTPNATILIHTWWMPFARSSFLKKPIYMVNGREGGAIISESLDRFTTNKEWKALYLCWQVIHLVVAYSYHYPIFLHTRNEPNWPQQKKTLPLWGDVCRHKGV